MAIKRAFAILALATFVSGTVHAEPASPGVTPVTTHPLRAAIARQREPLRPAASSHQRGTAPRKRYSTPTKVTAGVALGIAGFLVGTLATFGVQSAIGGPGGETTVLAGGVVGAGAGVTLGVWLASR